MPTACNLPPKPKHACIVHRLATHTLPTPFIHSCVPNPHPGSLAPAMIILSQPALNPGRVSLSEVAPQVGPQPALLCCRVLRLGVPSAFLGGRAGILALGPVGCDVEAAGASAGGRAASAQVSRTLVMCSEQASGPLHPTLHQPTGVPSSAHSGHALLLGLLGVYSKVYPQ